MPASYIRAARADVIENTQHWSCSDVGEWNRCVCRVRLGTGCAARVAFAVGAMDVDVR